MLCLKAEALDDHDLEHNCQRQNQTSPSSSINNNNNNIGFILPINFSIHRYLGKKVRSFSSGNGLVSSSNFEPYQTWRLQVSKLQDETQGENLFYKCQLEQDVKHLQQQLQKEIDLHLALACAAERSDSILSNSTCLHPGKAQDLLNSIAVLEITVSKLEQEIEALQYQLSQERNERRVSEYGLKITRPCSRKNDEEKINLMPAVLAVGKPNNNNFKENLCCHPSHLSEEMILCMRDIFLFLGDSSKLSSSEYMTLPPSPQGHLSYSSLASFSDSSIINPLAQSTTVDTDHDSEVIARESMFDPYGVPHKVDWKGSIVCYDTAVEVSCLSVGKKELEYAAIALKRFRLLLEHLTRVDISCMSCNEKLTFWINLYNALIMHGPDFFQLPFYILLCQAFLAYGVPTSEMKFLSLIQKATYTVGGHSFTAADIEFIILKMKPPAYRPQIAMVLALQKFRVSEEIKKYSIDHREPLLSFALSCGMHSSPAVRIFRPENVTELLKESLRDYVQASVSISNKGKLLIPKLLHCFAKGIAEDSALPDWMCQFLSPEQAAVVKGCLSHPKWTLLGARGFSVLPYDLRFRYLFLMHQRNG